MKETQSLINIWIFFLHLDENKAIARDIANLTGIEIAQEGKY